MAFYPFSNDPKMYISNHRGLNSLNRLVLGLTYCQNYAFATAFSAFEIQTPGKLFQTSLFF